MNSFLFIDNFDEIESGYISAYFNKMYFNGLRFPACRENKKFLNNFRRRFIGPLPATYYYRLSCISNFLRNKKTHFEFLKKQHEERQKIWHDKGQSQAYMRKNRFGNLSHNWFVRQMKEITGMEIDRCEECWDQPLTEADVEYYVRPIVRKCKYCKNILQGITSDECACDVSLFQSETYNKRTDKIPFIRSILLLYKLKALIKLLRIRRNNNNKFSNSFHDYCKVNHVENINCKNLKCRSAKLDRVLFPPPEICWPEAELPTYQYSANFDAWDNFKFHAYIFWRKWFCCERFQVFEEAESCFPESEPASAVQSSVGDIETDQASNVVLPVTREIDRNVNRLPDVAFRWDLLCTTDVQSNIFPYTDRWLKIANFVWNTSQVADGILVDLALPYEIFLSKYNVCQVPNLIAFNVNRYVRTDMEIRIQVNSNRFQVGQLIAYFIYSLNTDANWLTYKFPFRAVQLNHCLISASSSNEGSLYITYRYPAPFIRSKPVAGYSHHLNMGSFILQVMNPLITGARGPTSCTGNVYIRFPNCVFTGMLPSNIDTIPVPTETCNIESENPEQFNPSIQHSVTQYGFRQFCENFNDLKNYCRRYQYYCSIALTSLSDLQSGRCIFKFPVMPQGLALDIGNFKEVNNVSNRLREGHIPILLSGYRMYRGSIRFRLLMPPMDNLYVSVQHRPDRRLVKSTRNESPVLCSVLETGDGLFNHSYAYYIQVTAINPIIEFEVPFYQSAQFGLLQRPDDSITDEGFFTMGEVIVAVFGDIKPKNLLNNIIPVFYSFGDDFSPYLFQGFPPMMLLDDIPAESPFQMSVSDNINIDWCTPEMAMPVLTTMGEMGLVYALSKMCADNNRDNPPDVSPPKYLVPTGAHSWCIGNNLPEPLHPLRLDGVAQIPHPGMSNDINFTVKDITKVWGLLSRVSWKNDGTVGKCLKIYDAAPILSKDQYDENDGGSTDNTKGAAPKYYMPPLSVISSMFMYWRGSIEFRFDIIASDYHTGQLLVAYFPGVDASNDSITLPNAQSCANAVFSLQEKRQFSFIVPYISDRPWWMRRYAGNYSASNTKPPSVLALFIQNQLISMESAPDTVYINVYCRAGEDFEVAVPAQPSIGLGYNNNYLVNPKEDILIPSSIQPLALTSQGINADKYFPSDTKMFALGDSSVAVYDREVIYWMPNFQIPMFDTYFEEEQQKDKSVKTKEYLLNLYALVCQEKDFMLYYPTGASATAIPKLYALMALPRRTSAGIRMGGQFLMGIVGSENADSVTSVNLNSTLVTSMTTLAKNDFSYVTAKNVMLTDVCDPSWGIAVREFNLGFPLKVKSTSVRSQKLAPPSWVRASNICQPEMFSRIASKVDKFIDDKITKSKNEIMEEASGTVSKIVEDTNKVLDETLQEVTKDLDASKRSLIIGIVSQVMHALVNPTLRTIAIGIASVLAQLGLLMWEFISMFVEKFLNFLKSLNLAFIRNLNSNVQVKDSATPVEQAQGVQTCNKEGPLVEEDSSVGLLTSLFMGISSALSITCNVPKNLVEFKKFLVKDLKDCLTASNAFCTFLRNIHVVAGKFFKYIVGDKHPEYRLLEMLKDDPEPLKKWASKVLILTDPKVYAENVGKPQYADDVWDAFEFGTLIVSELIISLKDVNSHFLVKLYDKISKIRDNLVALGKHPHARKEPFCIWMYGDPGIGKSFISERISQYLLNSINYKTERSLMCVLNPLSKYWDMCEHQPILMVDDMFNVQTATAIEQQVQWMYMVKSTVPLNPPMAELSDKKMRYNPEIFYINSNAAFVNFNGINSDAIHRRRDVLIQAKLAPKQGVDGCNHCKGLSLATCDADKLADFHHLLFSFCINPCNPSMDASNWSPYYVYNDFILKLKDRYISFHTAETKRFSQRIDSLYCFSESIVCEVDSDLTMYFNEWKKQRDYRIADMHKGTLTTIYQTFADKLIVSKDYVKKFYSKILNREIVSDDKDAVSYCLPENEEGESSVSQAKKDLELIQDLPKIECVNDVLLLKFDTHKNVSSQFKRVFAKLYKYEDEKTNEIIKFVLERKSLIRNSTDLLYTYNLFAHADSRRSVPCDHMSLRLPYTYFDEKKRQFCDTVTNFVVSEDVCCDSCIFLSRFLTFAFYDSWSYLNPSVKLMTKRVEKYKSLLPKYYTSNDITLYVNTFKYRLNCLYKFLVNNICPKITSFFYTLSLVARVLVPILSLGFLGRMAYDYTVDRQHELEIKDGGFTVEVENSAYEIVTGKSIVATPATRVVPEANVQHMDVVISALRKNVVWIMAEWDTFKQKVRCLGLAGRKLLILRHYVEEFMSLPIDTKFTVWYGDINELQYSGVRVDFRALVVHWFNYVKQNEAYTSNVGILELPKQFPEFKNITKFIATKEDHKRINSDGAVIESGVGVIYLPFVSEKHAFALAATNNTSAVLMENVYTYQRHAPGMCGSILISSNLNRPIIGVHVAGNNKTNKGVAELIYSEMFCKLNNIDKEICIPKLNDLSQSKIDLDTVVFPYGVVPNSLAHHQSDTSTYVPSKIHGCVPVDTYPNPLSKNHPLYPKEFESPLLLGVRKHGQVTFPFPKDIVLECYDRLSRDIIVSVKPVRQKITVLSEEIAICGDNQIKYFDSIDMGTSEGWPLSSLRPPGVSNKSWLFDIDNKDGKLQLLKINSELRRQLDVSMEMRRRNIKPFTLFIDCLKDTCIPIEKCSLPGKTRIFSISPIQFTIQFKQYFMDFLSSYQLARLDANHAIGINCDSIEWGDMVSKLLKVNDKFICGDYSNFGPSLDTNIAAIALDIILQWYRHHTKDDLNFKENMLIREIMCDEIINAPHLCKNLVYYTFCSIPSGSPITAPLNSLVNELYIMISWKMLIPSPYNSMHAFRENTALVTYGDDLIMTVSDEYIEMFNTESLSDFFSSYNIKFTDFDKSDKIVKYRNLTEASFLKRTFKVHPYRSGQFLAPLDLVSINGCLNWITKKGNFLTNTVVNCDTALRLAYSHGEEVYNYYLDIILNNLAKQGYKNFNYFTWKELDRRVFDDNYVLCVWKEVV